MSRTGERVMVASYRTTAEQYLIYLFHKIGYQFARSYVTHRRVLDFGCGTGYGAAEIAVDADQVVAVDIEPEAIQYARDNFQAPNLTFETVEADRPLCFPDHSFDTVLSFQVIEHVSEPSRYLGEIWRILRPGGHLVLTTPDRHTRLLPGQRPWNCWHVTEYSRQSLHRTLARHFSRIELLGMTGHEEVIEIELRRARRAKWLTLPITLPLYPDRFRVRLLKQIQRLRGVPVVEAADQPPSFGFDESALRIGIDARPSVNHVVVAQR